MKNMGYSETTSNLGATVFKNRAIQMKIVDTHRVDHSQQNANPTNSIETVVIEVVRESSIYVAGLFAVYMTADIVRQVAIHIAKTKIK